MQRLERASAEPRPPRGATARVSLRTALTDNNLLGSILAGPSWLPWRALLLAAMGETLTADERRLFRQLTGRDHEPNKRIEEFVGVIGRRGGKSRAISVLATYLAALCDHPALVAGERGLVLCVAPDTNQSDVVLDYIEANFRQSPILKQLISARTQRTLRLTNKIDVEVRAASFRRLRGPTYVAVIADEVAFYHTEDSANPDTEILAAVRPGLATTHGPLFLISSPYARRGELWTLYRQHYGPAGDPLILVAQADSRTMNSTLAQSVVDRATERDPTSAAAEYGAAFRTDLEAFVLREAVEAVVSTGVRERPPLSGVRYFGFVDPSGGSSDSFTLAIAHHERTGDVVVIDALREVRAPFSPTNVVAEFAGLLHQYNITKVVGDRYGGEWPREAFRQHRINYEPSALPKSDLYIGLLPLLNSGRINLLDHSRLLNQLISLQRRTARSGKDSIDHPPGAHDDVSNAVAGAASLAAGRAPMRISQDVKQWAAIPQRFDGRWHSLGRQSRSGYL
jgi:hypothetical protein